MNIYVASSWRNERQPDVVKALRAAGHEVYDFKNPELGENGFNWRALDPSWKDWSLEKFIEMLDHPVAQAGFKRDMDALYNAEACVYVLPCGRSASLEMGWSIGRGLVTIILLADGEPELMFKMADHICTTIEQIVDILGRFSGGIRVGGAVARLEGEAAADAQK